MHRQGRQKTAERLIYSRMDFLHAALAGPVFTQHLLLPLKGQPFKVWTPQSDNDLDGLAEGTRAGGGLIGAGEKPLDASVEELPVCGLQQRP